MKITKYLVRYEILNIILLLINFPVLSQDQSPGEPYFANLKFHYGFVLKHSDKVGHLANQHPWGIEADVFKMTVGKKQWQRIHNYPIVGYTFHYFHLDPSKPLGDYYSALIYYSQYIIKSKKFFLLYRFGIGPGYTSKRFDIHNNYKNNINGSHFNFCLNARISAYYQISSKLYLTAGIGVIHFSNGTVKLPNQGINIPSVHLGIAYAPYQRPRSLPKDTSRSFSKKLNFNIVANAGIKQEYPVGKKEWLASTLTFYVSKQVSRRSILNGGFDFFYDGSKKLYLDTMANQNKIRLYRSGIMVGHEYLMGKVSLLTQFGYYLYDPLKTDKPVYQRLGLKYYISRYWFANVNLKTHFGSADYVEWGVGLKL